MFAIQAIPIVTTVTRSSLIIPIDRHHTPQVQRKVTARGMLRRARTERAQLQAEASGGQKGRSNRIATRDRAFTEWAEDIMMTADRFNKNGSVSVAELRANLAGGVHEDFMEWLLVNHHKRFDYYDEDHGGELELGELAHAIHEYNDGFTRGGAAGIADNFARGGPHGVPHGIMGGGNAVGREGSVTFSVGVGGGGGGGGAAPTVGFWGGGGGGGGGGVANSNGLNELSMQTPGFETDDGDGGGDGGGANSPGGGSKMTNITDGEGSGSAPVANLHDGDGTLGTAAAALVHRPTTPPSTLSNSTNRPNRPNPATVYDPEGDVIDPKNCSVSSAMSYYQNSAQKGVVGEKLVPSALHSFESMTTQGQQHPHRRITEMPQQSPEKPALILNQPEASIIRCARLQFYVSYHRHYATIVSGIQNNWCMPRR